MKTLTLLLVALGGLVACSDATIRKVPNRASYERWTDKQQRDVDCMNGLRFYRSRPYVVVHQPFPLTSNSYLVDGVVSADGRYVHLTPKASRAGTKEAAKLSEDLHHFSAGASGTDLPTSAIWKDLSTKPDSSNPRDIPTTQGATVAPPPFVETPTREQGADSPTGTGTLALQTDLEAIATKKLGERFELIYLPDFEEEYVIDPRANLGALQVSLAQGPGGVLMAMGMRLDNSVITRPITQAYTRSLEALGSRLATVLGQDPAESLVIPDTEGADISPKASDRVAGSRITLKVHVVNMASPGIYPILKASELLDSRNCLRELTRCKRCAGQRVPCSDCQSCVEDTPGSRARSSLLVPCEYPYSRIAYQTHRIVLVEHLISSPSRPKFVGFAQGGKPADTVLTKEAKPIADLKTMANWLNVRLKRSPKTRCLIAQVLSMTPSEGGAPGDFTAVSIVLKKKDGSGAAIPISKREACRSGAAEVVRAALPNILKPDLRFP